MTILFISLPNPCRTTMSTWIRRNPTNATIPRKWMLRAAWRLPNSLGYQGNRPSMVGDIATPVSIWSGVRKKITPK
jgi:hypothetical protein